MPEKAGKGISLSSIRTFSSLRNPGYRLYFFGMLGQFASMNMNMVTAPMLLYRITGSPALLGTSSLASAIPMLLLSMFGGAVADRMDKKKLLIIGLIFASLVSLATALLLNTGIISEAKPGSGWILIASSFVQGIIMGMMLPARSAIIPEIVTRDQVMNAVALNTLGMNVFRLAAPAAAGFLIAAFDFKSVYYTMAILNVYAISLVVFVPSSGKTAASTTNILSDIRDCFVYVAKEKTVMWVLLFTLFVVILSQPYQQMLPIFVDDILKVGEKGMGMLLSLSGAGAMVGSLALASAPNKKRGIVMIISGLVSGLSLIWFSFSTNWNLSLSAIVFVGVGQTVRATLSSALLQSYVEPDYMGRVMSIFMMEWGLVSLCTFFAGIMAEVLPVQWVVGGFAMALVVISILTVIFSPRLRKLE